MQKIGNPTPIFLDAGGTLLDGGKIYVGVANSDPQANPIEAFFDHELTIPALQPIRILGGQIVNGAQPASIFIAEEDYSLRVRDVFDVQVNYSPSVYVSSSAFQPLDSDLTAIAALGTTAFGRSLLALADAGALRTATGISAPLPLAGGIMTGGIVRSGAGGYPYYADGAMYAGRIFLTAVGASDPTSLAGDLWFTY